MKPRDTISFCYHGQHSVPRSTMRAPPGLRSKRRVCAGCYAKIMADRKARDVKG